MAAFTINASRALAESRFLLQDWKGVGIKPDGCIALRDNPGDPLKYVYPVSLPMIYPHCPKAQEVYKSESPEMHNGVRAVVFSLSLVDPTLIAPAIDYWITSKLPTTGCQMILIGSQMGTREMADEGRRILTGNIKVKRDTYSEKMVSSKKSSLR